MDRIIGGSASPDDVPKRFFTTRWSLVLGARSADAGEARAALEALCSAYWYPVYAFVRRKGFGADEAQDLAQGFFLRLLERNDLATLDQSKGRLRSFLMAACSNHLANEADRARAVKRGGGRVPVSIDRLRAEGRYGLEPVDGLTAERLFERRWALTILDRALERLETAMREAGKGRLFEALKPALLGTAERAPFAEIGRDLGISEPAARAAAKRLRHSYRELLRDEVAATLDDPSEVDVEIRALFAALASVKD